MNETYDLIIIGGGPAGLTAAIYASRANLSTLVIESAVSGGKLHKTHEIENYPAVSKVIGSELAEQFVAHSQEFGAKIVTGEVTKIETFGCFVEVWPGCEGLVHISKLSKDHVEKCEDVVKVGDEIIVKAIGTDNKGRLNFSRKDAM